MAQSLVTICRDLSINTVYISLLHQPRFSCYFAVHEMYLLSEPYNS